MPEGSEDTTPIVGMAVSALVARDITLAMSGWRNPFGEGAFRLGRRHDSTVYCGDRFWAWFATPELARSVVYALNGEENTDDC